MATLAAPGRATASGGHRFFAITAWLMLAVIVAGFSNNLVAGRSSFGLPLIFHVHAFVFFGWMILYVAQNSLVAAGNIKMHRNLGWLAVGWLPVMVALGTSVAVTALRDHGGAFFFDSNEFLFGSVLALFYLGGLGAWSIAWRRRTDWHRRLMYCGVSVLTGPGVGRLLPMPLFMPWAWWVNQAAPLALMLAGMVYDHRRNGRIHPAYLWALGIFVLVHFVGEALAYSAPGLAFTHWLLIGAPAEHIDLRAGLH